MSNLTSTFVSSINELDLLGLDKKSYKKQKKCTVCNKSFGIFGATKKCCIFCYSAVCESCSTQRIWNPTAERSGRICNECFSKIIVQPRMQAKFYNEEALKTQQDSKHLDKKFKELKKQLQYEKSERARHEDILLQLEHQQKQQEDEYQQTIYEVEKLEKQLLDEQLEYEERLKASNDPEVQDSGLLLATDENRLLSEKYNELAKERRYLKSLTMEHTMALMENGKLLAEIGRHRRSSGFCACQLINQAYIMATSFIDVVSELDRNSDKNSYKRHVSCTNCAASFGMFGATKYNCQFCWRAVCSKCCSQKVWSPITQRSNHICNECFERCVIQPRRQQRLMSQHAKESQDLDSTYEQLRESYTQERAQRTQFEDKFRELDEETKEFQSKQEDLDDKMKKYHHKLEKRLEEYEKSMQEIENFLKKEDHGSHGGEEGNFYKLALENRMLTSTINNLETENRKLRGMNLEIAMVGMQNRMLKTEAAKPRGSQGGCCR